ncbi:hypothetical protein EPUS_03946 [Endocarpon pusillum Z07020]|uniref:Uncharacterized protein n=1 Tax=Endocarpon pusillum (strain Z07020 / HMAS-L-300199) TaxID=1263415 RepID=U1GQ88_ENDPU|nr:uncharacterized protein EPUS_03946 [Endocarpon pusillum Z07020]ERF74508.1 hypothetical protein EPUS_03946 [Endocarpon pusillum Z07020]
MSQQFGSSMADDDNMDIDIDIDMDADVEPIPEPELEEGEEYELTPFNAPIPDTLVPAIYTEDPEQEIQPTKVHIRGIDDFSTDDVRNFAMDYFSPPPTFVQWIDDTSANLVYPSSDLALQALEALCAVTPTKTDIINSPLQLREAKPRAGSHLQVRRATASDKKRRNAKEASRYYLLHPEADPIERMRAEFANGRSRRNGDHGDYQRRRYNDREDRRRRDQDANGESGGGADFNASMYDDNPEPARPSRSRGAGGGRRTARNRSASPGRSTTNSDEIILDDASDPSETERPSSSSFRRNRPTNRFRDRSPPPTYSRDDPHPFPKANREKELFPSSISGTQTSSGQLASDKLQAQKQADRVAAAAKLKKELFPNRTDRSNHRRSDAFDARAKADAANADELSRRMRGRMDISDHNTPASASSNGNAGKELFSTPTSSSGAGPRSGDDSGLNIKGTAGLSIKGGAGMSIKGAATAPANVRELFPDKFVKGGSGNEGKELFSDKIRGRGTLRRNKAEDLFG